MGIKKGLQESGMASSQKSDFTDAEAELYDRQIRLWGLEAQKRLRHSRILIIGLGGLGAEVAKNIVLAGVKSLTLLDDKKVSPNDRSSQFFLHEADVGDWRSVKSKPKVNLLNLNVEVVSETDRVEDKSDEYFKQFHVICATDCSLSTLLRLDKVCRENNVYFFCGDTWGEHGYFFLDLGISYKYLPEVSVPAPQTEKIDDDDEEPAKKKPRTDFVTTKYSSLEQALAIKSGKAGVSLHKKTSKLFFLVHILLKFREAHQRLPSPEHHEEDVKLLKPLRKSVLESLGFNEDKISDDDLESIFGEISPICAVIGGVLAQEIIKAVSANMAPIQNFFLFDGNLCKGVVESVG